MMKPKLSDGRPPELLKALSDRVARALMLPNQQELAGMLQLVGLLGPHTPEPRPLDNAIPSGDYENAERVGIWERHTESGKPHFVRSISSVDEWHFWAGMQRIEP